jgi:hypothetical protein
MNESEHDLPSGFADSKTDLLEHYDQLRQLFVAALVAMLILSVGVIYFLYQQQKFVQKDLETVRPQLSLLLANYQKVEDPQIKTFVNALVAYGRTHPDFNPILAKYKIAPASPLPVPAVAAPTSAPPVSPKKK